MTHAFRFSDTLFRLDIRLLFWLSQSLYYICIFIFYFFLLIFPQIRHSTTVIAISGSVLPTGMSIFIRIRYKIKPITHSTILEIWISFSLWSSSNRKKSAIWIAIIGANTEPIRYKKFVILSIGYTIAARAPTTVTAMAIYFPFSLWLRVSLEIPAEYASRKVVVTVEKMMISSPTIPRPAFTMIWAISLSPV